MTIESLITAVREEKPNSFTDAKLISFINEIETEVAEELHIRRMNDYTTDDTSTELLVEAPYDRLYPSFLKMKIDYANEEYASYQLNAEQHTLDFQDFIDWVVRTGRSQNRFFPRRIRGTF